VKFSTSKDSYNDPSGAQSYLEFLETEDGAVFKETIFGAIRARLQDNPEQKILDAACGPGWLTAKLAAQFPNTEGLDGSKPFLDFARRRFPDLKFVEADLNSQLPYNDAAFDVVVMSMAAHDIEDQTRTFTELRRILKPGGQLILTIANPYYAFPVGVWKRGWLGRLLFKKPQLQVRPYHWFAKQDRDYSFYEGLESYFYKFSEHLNNLKAAGFNFEHMTELESLQDSSAYNLQYRLHRFPVILLVEARKN
jgi:ubiquinone/menaquinone biosynthesis C-methylase UbiE